ncbi:hypothetical protein [Leptotrichia hofstadii]|uniref:Uncharacterized protein n=1 Tax=Leptotrichia hofstadii F0254 TaxID=634994 RepID=C9MUL6_9FUSO|nr:hypothetical protein [Leptotrichia hofstadii]EEX75636.1 hypothetical protein GCWU000323_00235 [Leptotrichia hofstadii F0254]
MKYIRQQMNMIVGEEMIIRTIGEKEKLFLFFKMVQNFEKQIIEMENLKERNTGIMRMVKYIGY